MAITKTIATEDCDSDANDGMHPAVKSGGYCATRLPPTIDTFALRVPQHPLRLRQAKQILLNQINHRVPFGQQKRQPWSKDKD